MSIVLFVIIHVALLSLVPGIVSTSFFVDAGVMSTALDAEHVAVRTTGCCSCRSASTVNLSDSRNNRDSTCDPVGSFGEVPTAANEYEYMYIVYCEDCFL